jgi:uncharacterized damage-inducible protein DinB
MEHPAIQLYHYHNWANDRVLTHLMQLPDEVYRKEVKSVFSSIQEVAVHMYQAEGMWLSVMSGNSFSRTMEIINGLKEQSAGKDLAALHRLYKEMAGDYNAFLNKLEDPDESITINHPRYGELSTPVAQLVRHVANHGTYHRGNIAAMLRQQGQEGVPTDYIFYLYEIA